MKGESLSVFIAVIVLVTASGTELISIESALGSVQLLYPIFAVAMFLATLRRFPTRISWDFLLFALLFLSLIPSVVYSIHQSKSMAILARIAISYVAVAGCIRTLYGIAPISTVAGFIWSYRLQIVIAALLFYTGRQPMSEVDFGGSRAHLFYYEPSYMGISLGPFVAWCIIRCFYVDYNTSSIAYVIADIILLLLLLVITKSAMLLLLIATAVIVVPVLLPQSQSLLRFRYVMTSLGCIAIIAGIVIGNDKDDLLTNTIRDLATAEDKMSYLQQRSQNRYPRIVATLNTMLDFPIHGVGIGCFEEYSHSISMTEFSSDLVSKLVRGKPGVNAFLETGAEAGFPGFLGLTFFLAGVFFVAWKSAVTFAGILRIDQSDVAQLFFGPIGMLLMMIALSGASNAFRPYFWVVIGLNLGIASSCRNFKFNISHQQ